MFSSKRSHIGAFALSVAIRVRPLTGATDSLRVSISCHNLELFRISERGPECMRSSWRWLGWASGARHTVKYLVCLGDISHNVIDILRPSDALAALLCNVHGLLTGCGEKSCRANI